ncbi:HD domain-containing protein [Candidatus Woesearchaeota archaeon]|nr:HD domain-containing protein [Candidatus Woesearchaeota archaeon]
MSSDIPPVQECYRLLEEWKTAPNVVRHSEQVAKVAVLIAGKMREKGIDVNVDMIRAAALLHDLIRLCDVKELKPMPGERDFTEEELEAYRQHAERFRGKKHGEAACEVLAQSYPQIAEIIRKHAFSAVSTGELKTWEEKIVYYADKRVAHDRIVTLAQRQKEAESRYPVTKESKRLWKMVKELEKEIFKMIGTDPDMIGDTVG